MRLAETRVLFVHQNFPGQYAHLAATLAKISGCRVVALGDRQNMRKRARLADVELVGYPSPRPAANHTHHYVKPLESAVRRGQAVARACFDLRKNGLVPNVICAHPGWGEALYLKDVFPESRLVLYCEFFYHAAGHDVGFDPEFPASLDDVLRVRTRNATGLLSLSASDAGISPTHWQRSTFPGEFRDRIAVIHDGIDTDLVRPAPDAELVVPEKALSLSGKDEVITYVARNLEPYRGFHVFMRALPEIQKRRPRAHVVIVGEDGVSYSPRLPDGQNYKQKMLAQLGSSLDMSRIHFLGQVPYATLLNIYRISSAHIYLTYPFVLSWSLLEAMAAGCTVVASRTAPVQEVITDGDNGYLVDFLDTAALAAKVDLVLDGGNESIRERARSTVVERYDLRSVSLPRQLEFLDLAGS